MKRLVFESLLVLGIFVFFIGIGSAQSCAPAQTIFKISSSTNAHGENWDGTAYNTEICFTDYFDTSYDGTSTSHDANGASDNVVIRLSSATNAHAEDPIIVPQTYTNKIFFGQLSCELRNDLCEGYRDVTNDLDSAFIVSLSGDTNAHIALGDFYSKSLCCLAYKSDGTTPIDPICNYGDGDGDGLTCDPGENVNNCPSDCAPVSGSGVCGDGNVNKPNTGLQYEECDGTNLDGKECTSIPGGYTGGTLSCTSGCEFDTTQCIAGPGPNSDFCTDNSPFLYTKSGDTSGDTNTVSNCEEVNLITQDDIPSGENLNMFKQSLCQNMCDGINLVGEENNPLGNDGFDGGSDICAWKNDKCEFDWTEQSGSLECKLNYDEFPECAEGQLFRDIIISAITVKAGVAGQSCSCDNLGSVTCPKSVICPRVVKLPFFGTTGAILAVIVIGLVYYFYFVKKNKNKNKKRR